MYTLVKHYAPGWMKRFYSVETLTDALMVHICGPCKEIYGRDLEIMRSSDCGCEFSIQGIDMNEPPTEAEQWQIYLERKQYD